jgi:hypothetical protein
MDAELDLIPRAMRDKLDQVRIKLHLRQWQALSIEERRELLTLPCATIAEQARYARLLNRALAQRLGEEPTRLSE